MKRYLAYDEMLESLDRLIPSLQQEGYSEVVAVVRGGLTAAHYIAKQLRLPVGVYYPKNDAYPTPRIMLAKRDARKLLFVEDLVAKGRTHDELVEFMTGFPQTEYDFLPVLVDGAYPKPFKYYGMKTHDWIVMPYEHYDSMVEGDRGLFRNNTDSYGVST